MSTCCYGFNMRHEGHAWKNKFLQLIVKDRLIKLRFLHFYFKTTQKIMSCDLAIHVLLRTWTNLIIFKTGFPCLCTKPLLRRTFDSHAALFSTSLR